MAIYGFYVNHDERGDFYADVRNEEGDTVFDIRSKDGVIDLVDDGFMRHKVDLDGLVEYLLVGGLLGKEDELLPMAEFERRIAVALSDDFDI